MRINKRVRILFISISAPLLFVVASVLVVAAYTTFHRPPEVDVLTTGFAPQKIEITEGETVHFVNRSSTAQILCLGMDKSCDRSAVLFLEMPPQALFSPGLRLAPHQTKDVVFDTDGTFTITSTVVPGMNLTVTVDAGAS